MHWDKLLSTKRSGPTTSAETPTRTAFDGDYDRAIFSTPLRRLQDKAQVFPLDPNDAVRTRLTHSLEVSTIARSLARQAMEIVLKDDRVPAALKPRPDQVRSIEIIAATCGLIHDFGNPPFGHAGEDAIRQWFHDHPNLLAPLETEQQKHDFLRFEGNAQTLRLVGRLQVLADYNGLNLTFGTLSAACKYTAPSDRADESSQYQERTKPGFFTSEQDLVNVVRQETHTLEARNPIAFLVEAADDIVYSAGDIEDAVKKGILRWSDARKKLIQCAKDDGEVDERLVQEVIDAAKGQIEKQMARSPIRPRIYDDTFATAFRIQVQGRAIGSVLETFASRYEEIMNGSYHGSLVAEGHARSIVRACKRFGQLHVYGAQATPKLEVLGRNVLHDLMDIFWKGAQVASEPGKTKTFPEKIASLISKNYLDVMLTSIKEKKLPERYHRLQLVTDFVCGMTDTFAQDMHRDLFNG